MALAVPGQRHYSEGIHMTILLLDADIHWSIAL
jgi:hypothetical protein